MKMDIDSACMILGVTRDASIAEINSAKRKALQALHPDKHSPQQKEFFERMTRHVVEAAKLLKTEPQGTPTHKKKTSVYSTVSETPYRRDTRLVKVLAEHLSGYASSVKNPPTLNMVRLIQLIGEALCETPEAKELFGGMLQSFRDDYKQVGTYLLNGWTRR